MKYYVYISDTKVDMIYPQIPKPLLKKIASDLSIDIKLFGVEASLLSKVNPSEETRYAKVKVVTEYIEKHLNVGSIDAPNAYFKGRLPLQYALLEKQAVYFGGVTDRTIFGLSGSAKHLIGVEPEQNVGISPSLLPGFEDVAKNISRAENTPSGAIGKEADMILEAIVYLTKKSLRGPQQQLEFLAKTLLQDSLKPSTRFVKSIIGSHLHVVLGTPIYVAMND